MFSRFSRRSTLKMLAGSTATLLGGGLFSGATAAVTGQRQAIAEEAAKDSEIAAFYRARDFKPIFTGSGDRRRRSALLKAMAKAGDHGLPVQRYDAGKLKAMFAAAKTPRDVGKVEVEAAREFLAFADDLRSGVLVPRDVDPGLVLDVARYDRTSTLEAFSQSSPQGFLKRLSPRSPAYVRLQKEKRRLEKLVAKGGWGPKVRSKSLKPGATGDAVVQLRNRLIAMGYSRRTVSQTYDRKMKKAVQAFQIAHGLPADGVAGKATIGEVNRSAEYRLTSVLVALERQRWNNRPLANKHVWVNIADFHVDIVENGKSTFRSRVVVGKNTSDRRTPEFSDEMDHMVINPSWYVPRSIIGKEYLPLLRENPSAVGHLLITDSAGRRVNREAVDFAQYNERNFPFAMRQPPSRSNALGLVKFMFPNKHNIYLHDTPAKNLFGRDQRAYSHGCIRVHQPFDFAYALLKAQTNNPKGFFHSKLETGQEQRVDLERKLPVHLVYFTAWVDAKGRANFRRDVYGRDARIFKALERSGVSLA